MRPFNYYIIFGALLIIASCKKKEYPQSSVEGAPVFNCTMTVNGNPVSIGAGTNNYYMYSSFQQDSNNVYGFIAGLQQENCTSCPNSIQVQINDFRVLAPNATTKIDSALIAGTYNYLGSSASAFYTAQFQSSYNKPAAAYLWNFGDGATSFSANPVHIYKRPGKYNVSLTVTGNSGCVSNVYGFENIGLLATGFHTSIIDSGAFGNTVSLLANNLQGIAPYSYFWNFGDGAISSSANPSHTYLYSGSYPVSLRVIDGNNDTAYAKYNAITQNDISSCTANYTVANVSPTPNTLGLSNIVVKWTDANGIVYTSKDPLQPAGSYFKILSVDDYSNNDNNQLTKKLHVKFSCTVYNGTSSILISNADAIICVAYK